MEGKMIRLITVLVYSLLAINMIYAQSTRSSGADILDITPSAYQQLLGNVDGVEYQDPNILFYNPGGMV